MARNNLKISHYRISLCWGTPIIWVYCGNQAYPLGAGLTREILNRTLSKALLGKKVQLYERKNRLYANLRPVARGD